MGDRAPRLRLATALGLASALLIPGISAADFQRYTTTTSVVVQPPVAAGGVPVKFVATVKPAPDGGSVTFTIWSAATGGQTLETETIAVNASGKATWDDHLLFPIGSYWAQASYNGTPYFAPSSSERAPLTVVPTQPTVSMAAPTEVWQGSPLIVDWTVVPADAVRGVLELLVDGDVYASRRLYSGNKAGSWAVPALIEPGDHQIQLRHAPAEWKYGPGPSNTQPLRVLTASTDDDFLPFTSRSTSVAVIPPSTSGGQAVTSVRLSNSATMDGQLLADGVTTTWQPVLDWTIPGSGDGWRTVWMQLQRAGGSWTTPSSDSVYLDRTAPVGTFLINGGAATLGSAWGGGLNEQELTGQVSDGSLAEGGSITHVAISNDGMHWNVIPFEQDPSSFLYTWQVIDSAWGPEWHPGDDRIRTVYMKWRDRAGNWSVVMTQQIDMLWGAQPVDMFIDDVGLLPTGEVPYVSNPIVTLTFPVYIEPEGGIDYVLIHNIGSTKVKKVNWTPNLAVQWSLVDPTFEYSSADGIKRVYAEVYPKSGHFREVGGMVILDRVTPTSSVPLPAFGINTTVGASSSLAGIVAGQTSVAAEIAWTGSDAQGMAAYGLQRKVNTAAWSTVALVDPTLPKAVEMINVGSSFRYRSRGVDSAGNAGSWRQGPEFKLQVRDETAAALVYSRGWRAVSRADAIGGKVRVTSTKGASVKLTFTGRAIAWVAPRSAAGDVADVYVDGHRVKTVYLTAGSYKPRLVVFSMSWKSVGTHTIRIVKKYANSGEVAVDSLLVLR